MNPADAYPVRVMILAGDNRDAPVLVLAIEESTELHEVLQDLREAVRTRSHVLLAATSAEALAPIEEAMFDLTQAAPALTH